MRLLARRRLGRDETPGDPVVTGAAGAATFKQTLTACFRDYADRVGLAAVVHDLRPTYASWSVNEMAMPLTVVAQHMGHADVRRAASYQRVTATTVHEALARTLAAAGAAPSSNFGRVAFPGLGSAARPLDAHRDPAA